MRGTSTNGAYWWLHAEPLNATTRQALAPYWAGGCYGRRCHRTIKTQRHNYILASDCRTFFLVVCINFGTQNGLSIQLIEVTSFVKGRVYIFAARRLVPILAGALFYVLLHLVFLVYDTSKIKRGISPPKIKGLA
jgi:hypothetical protein